MVEDCGDNMSYTNVWSDSTPLGSAAANTIDDIFRALKVDIEQRISDLHGITDFTTDPLKSQYIRAGYGTSTKGGYVRLTDDTGTLRWQAGIRDTAAAKDYVVHDIVAGVTRLTIDNTTGRVTVANDLTVSGGAVISTGGLAVNGGATTLASTLVVASTATFNANIVLTADGAEVSTTTAGVTTSRFKTDASGGLIAVDGNNPFRIITNNVDRLTVSGVGAVAISGTLNVTGSTTLGTANIVLVAAGASGITSTGPTAIAALSATTGTFTSTLVTGAAAAIGWSGASLLKNSSDGVIRLSNNAGTDFGRLQFGGTTSSFPAIARNGAAFQLRLADDSAYTNLTAATITATAFSGPLTGNVVGNVTGNASTATALATARNINGVAFDGTANITVAAASGTLTGATLAANVLASSLTSVGTLTSLAVGGSINASKIYGNSSAPSSSSLATGVTSITFGSGSNNMHGSIIITSDNAGGSIAAGTTLGVITYANAYTGTPTLLLYIPTAAVSGSTLGVGFLGASNTGFSIYLNFDKLRNGTTTTIYYHALGN